MDISERDAMILDHLEVAQAYARRAARGRIEEEEVHGEAALATVRAASEFDPDLGFKFVTYLRWWTRRYIQDAVRRSGYLPGTFRYSARRIPFDLVSPMARPDADPIDAAILEKLPALLDRLPNRYRKSVVRRYGIGGTKSRGDTSDALHDIGIEKLRALYDEVI